ncbi:hypothetical protein [Streptomyces sp. NPDC060031]|uniref:hypothetical protein n=1 Tax=Streptomyces sp. NPDC060031 TaxID=3347043 RepID=UPI0036AB0B02
MFSLGSTIAFAASGEDLFGGGAAAGVLFRVVHTAPLDAVPENLRPLVAACLAKDPARRPTPAELIGSLGSQASQASQARAVRPGPSAGWLPAPVSEDIMAVRPVLTSLPAQPPTKQFTQSTRNLRALPPDQLPEPLPDGLADRIPGRRSGTRLGRVRPGPRRDGEGGGHLRGGRTRGRARRRRALGTPVSETVPGG